jgi:hypothetical protein
MNRQHQALIDRIESSGKEFLEYLSRLPEEEIHRVPANGEWSAHAVVAHLRDTEEHVFLKRTHRILDADAPPAVENFDQDEWNREHYSPDEPLDKIISEWRAARRKEIALLRKTSDKDWAKWAVHPEYQKISIEWLATHNYSHTLEHLRQLLVMREKQILGELNRERTGGHQA